MVDSFPELRQQVLATLTPETQADRAAGQRVLEAVAIVALKGSPERVVIDFMTGPEGATLDWGLVESVVEETVQRFGPTLTALRRLACARYEAYRAAGQTPPAAQAQVLADVRTGFLGQT